MPPMRVTMQGSGQEVPVPTNRSWVARGHGQLRWSDPEPWGHLTCSGAGDLPGGSRRILRAPLGAFPSGKSSGKRCEGRVGQPQGSG